jgi:glutathione S-transferase
MAGLVLYDHPVSSNALRARFLLAELGLPYERRHVSFAEPRPADYLALNPFGRIPTLLDGELVLAESNAILRYLANRERRDDLYPLDPRERARVDWAMDAWSTIVRPPLFALEAVTIFRDGREEGGGSAEGADPEAVAATLPRIDATLSAYEQFVAGNGTVLGAFTIADCSVGPILWRTLRLPLDLSSYPKLAQLRESVAARPSFQAAGPVG